MGEFDLRARDTGCLAQLALIADKKGVGPLVVKYREVGNQIVAETKEKLTEKVR
jgi:hypothetical protein